jgi:hypothetical protein
VTLDFSAREALAKLNEGDRLLVLTWGACGMTSPDVREILNVATIQGERRENLLRAFNLIFPGRWSAPGGRVR